MYYIARSAADKLILLDDQNLPTDAPGLVDSGFSLYRVQMNPGTAVLIPQRTINQVQQTATTSVEFEDDI